MVSKGTRGQGTFDHNTPNRGVNHSNISKLIKVSVKSIPPEVQIQCLLSGICYTKILEIAVLEEKTFVGKAIEILLQANQQEIEKKIQI